MHAPCQYTCTILYACIPAIKHGIGGQVLLLALLRYHAARALVYLGKLDLLKDFSLFEPTATGRKYMYYIGYYTNIVWILCGYYTNIVWILYGYCRNNNMLLCGYLYYKFIKVHAG